MKNKRVVALLIVISTLIGMCPNVFAKSDEKYGLLPVSWFSSGNIENLTVMLKDDHLYANAKTIAEKLGYNFSETKDRFTIKKLLHSKLRMVLFKVDSDKIAYSTGFFTFEYTLPFKAIKNERGCWVPFVYVLRLLDSGYLIDSSIVTQPSETLLGTYAGIRDDKSKYKFDIVNDFSDSVARLAVCELVNIWNGWLSLDPNYFGNNKMDAKYLENIATLFCTMSQEEIRENGKLISLSAGILSSVDDVGKYAKLLNGHYKWESGEITKLIKYAKKQSASSGEIEQLEKALERATKNEEVSGNLSDIFSDASKELDAESLSNRITGAAMFLEMVSYISEYANQDDTSLETMRAFVNDLQKDGPAYLTDNGVKSLNNYVNSADFELTILAYSLYKTLQNNILSVVKLTTSVDVQKYLFGTEGCLVLLGWNLASAFFPCIKNGLDNSEKSQLALYCLAMQKEAALWMANCENEALRNPDSKDSWTKLARGMYAYLKMCHISRQNGMNILDTYIKKRQEKESMAKKLLNAKNLPKNGKKNLNSELQKIQDELKLLQDFKDSLDSLDSEVATNASLYHVLCDDFDNCDFTSRFGMIPLVEAKVKEGYDELDNQIKEHVLIGYSTVELTKEDKNSIAKLLSLLTDAKYDCTDIDALSNAMWIGMNPVTGIWLSFDYPGTDKICQGFYNYEEEFSNDPLNAFDFDDSDGICGYIKLEGKTTDWILKNILNVTPVHSSKVSTMMDNPDDMNYQSTLEYYYYKGYYYVESPGGMESWDGYSICFDKIVGNGTDYQIKFKRLYESWEGNILFDESFT